MTISNKVTIPVISNLPGQKGSGGTPPPPPPQPTPDQFTTPTDTGINMTAAIAAPAVINTPYAGGELGAFYDLNGDGNLQCVGLSAIPDPSNTFSLVIWGRTPGSPTKDGLDAGDIPLFAILDGGVGYELDPLPVFPGYVDNGIIIVTGGTVTPL